MNNTTDYLLEHGIRPSPQRVAIMDYLQCHRTHPTVDNVYAALHPNMPTLSKTTVYNILKLFEEKSAILVLNLDEKNLHFDADISTHAHFLCQECGKVFDIFLDEESLQHVIELSKNPNLKPYTISNTQISYKGICPECGKVSR